jgi:hypothetical protein
VAVTDRADLLELIDRAPGALRTFQARYESWADTTFVWGPRTPTSNDADPYPTIMEGRTDFWFEAPDRWHADRDGPPRGLRSVDIVDGDTRWIGAGDRLTMTGPADPPLANGMPFELEIRSGPMLGWMELDEPAAGDHEGRRAWIVHGRPRDGGTRQRGVPPNVSLVPSAEHRYTIDALTGIVLAHEARVDGGLCLRAGFTDVVVDEPIDDARFRPPDGAQVETVTEQHLKMLEREGVDTSSLDRDDPEAVRAAVFDWVRSKSKGSSSNPAILGTRRPEPPDDTPPD